MGTPRTHVSKPETNRYFAVVDPALANNTHAFQLELVGRDKDVLELGCAAGHMTRALVEQGCRVVALEVDAEAARFAEEFAERVVVGDLSDSHSLAPIEDDRFDVLLAGDVLEHLPDPLALLRRCRSLLRPDGALVLSVPNVAHVDLKLALLQGRWQYRDVGLLDRTHLRFFTRRSLDELLHAAGFVPVEIRRVVRPPGTTELAADARNVDAALLEVALSDPEAETYQFVVRALLDSEESVVDSAHSRLELATLLEVEIVRRRGLEADVAQLTDRLRRVTHELDVLHQSKVFRYSEWPRRLYTRLMRVRRL